MFKSLACDAVADVCKSLGLASAPGAAIIPEAPLSRNSFRGCQDTGNGLRSKEELGLSWYERHV